MGNISGRALLLVVALVFAMATAISVLPWLKQHIVASTVIASVCVVVGMWLERWSIIVSTITHPRLIPWSSYLPTATEYVNSKNYYWNIHICYNGINSRHGILY